MIQLDGSLNQVVLQRELNVNNQDLRFVNEIKAEPLDGSNRYGLYLTTPKSLSAAQPALVLSAGADRSDVSNNGVNLALRKEITSNSTSETIGQINFVGQDNTGNSYLGGYFGYTSLKNTAGSENGRLYLGAGRNGGI
jgi:hypothetical protein